MADSIVVNIAIAGHRYGLKASSPEKEEMIRRAAEIANKKISYYQKTFPGKSMEELLSFVVLNECITNLNEAKKGEEARKEVDSLVEQLGSYIDNIDNSRQ